MDGAAGIGESETLSCSGKQATHNRSEGHASVTVPPPRAVAIGRWEEGGEHGWREGWPPRRAPEGDVDEPPPHPALLPLLHGSTRSSHRLRSDVVATWPILVGFTWKARVEKRLESQAWARFKSFQRAACFDPLYI